MILHAIVTRPFNPALQLYLQRGITEHGRFVILIKISC